MSLSTLNLKISISKKKINTEPTIEILNLIVKGDINLHVQLRYIYVFISSLRNA